MATYQAALPTDSSSITNFKAWASGIGTALTALGWAKDTDSNGYMVNWTTLLANLSATPGSIITTANFPASVGTLNARGPFSSANSYIGTTTTNGACDMVTDNSLSWICVSNTLISVSSSGAVLNATKSESIQSVSAAVSSTTQYTITSDAGAAGNAYFGYVFVVTGCNNNANNGTFICTASSATILTLSNPVGVVQAGAAGTAASSNLNIGFTYANTNPNQGNQLTGQTMVVAGFTANSGANNGTYTVLASSATCWGAVANASASTESRTYSYNNVTAPHLNTVSNGTSGNPTAFGNWFPYLFEVWKTGSTGPLNGSNPTYLKFVYRCYGSAAPGTPQINYAVGTGHNGNGQITGNFSDFSNVGFPDRLVGANSVFAASFANCYFSGDQDNLRMIMWRNNPSFTFVLVIDRAKSSASTDIDAYTNVVEAGPAPSGNGFSCLMKSGNGTTQNMLANWPCPYWIGTTAFNGGFAVLPIFPMPGFLSNPMLGAIGLMTGDVVEGQLLNAVLYGASHTFLVTKNANPTFPTAMAIRWE